MLREYNAEHDIIEEPYFDDIPQQYRERRKGDKTKSESSTTDDHLVVSEKSSQSNNSPGKQDGYDEENVRSDRCRSTKMSMKRKSVSESHDESKNEDKSNDQSDKYDRRTFPRIVMKRKSVSRIHDESKSEDEFSEQSNTSVKRSSTRTSVKRKSGLGVHVERRNEDGSKSIRLRKDIPKSQCIDNDDGRDTVEEKQGVRKKKRYDHDGNSRGDTYVAEHNIVHVTYGTEMSETEKEHVFDEYATPCNLRRTGVKKNKRSEDMTGKSDESDPETLDKCSAKKQKLDDECDIVDGRIYHDQEMSTDNSDGHSDHEDRNGDSPKMKILIENMRGVLSDYYKMIPFHGTVRVTYTTIDFEECDVNPEVEIAERGHYYTTSCENDDETKNRGASSMKNDNENQECENRNVNKNIHVDKKEKQLKKKSMKRKNVKGIKKRSSKTSTRKNMIMSNDELGIDVKEMEPNMGEQMTNQNRSEEYGRNDEYNGMERSSMECGIKNVTTKQDGRKITTTQKKVQEYDDNEENERITNSSRICEMKSRASNQMRVNLDSSFIIQETDDDDIFGLDVKGQEDEITSRHVHDSETRNSKDERYVDDRRDESSMMNVFEDMQTNISEKDHQVSNECNIVDGVSQQNMDGNIIDGRQNRNVEIKINDVNDDDEDVISGMSSSSRWRIEEHISDDPSKLNNSVQNDEIRGKESFEGNSISVRTCESIQKQHQDHISETGNDSRLSETHITDHIVDKNIEQDVNLNSFGIIEETQMKEHTSNENVQQDVNMNLSHVMNDRNSDKIDDDDDDDRQCRDRKGESMTSNDNIFEEKKLSEISMQSKNLSEDHYVNPVDTKNDKNTYSNIICGTKDMSTEECMNIKSDNDIRFSKPESTTCVRLDDQSYVNVDIRQVQQSNAQNNIDYPEMVFYSTNHEECLKTEKQTVVNRRHDDDNEACVSHSNDSGQNFIHDEYQKYPINGDMQDLRHEVVTSVPISKDKNEDINDKRIEEDKYSQSITDVQSSHIEYDLSNKKDYVEKINDDLSTISQEMDMYMYTDYQEISSDVFMTNIHLNKTNVCVNDVHIENSTSDIMNESKRNGNNSSLIEQIPTIESSSVHDKIKENCEDIVEGYGEKILENSITNIVDGNITVVDKDIGTTARTRPFSRAQKPPNENQNTLYRGRRMWIEGCGDINLRDKVYENDQIDDATHLQRNIVHNSTIEHTSDISYEIGECNQHMKTHEDVVFSEKQKDDKYDLNDHRGNVKIKTYVGVRQDCYEDISDDNSGEKRVVNQIINADKSVYMTENHQIDNRGSSTDNLNKYVGDGQDCSQDIRLDDSREKGRFQKLVNTSRSFDMNENDFSQIDHRTSTVDDMNKYVRDRQDYHKYICDSESLHKTKTDVIMDSNKSSNIDGNN